MCLSKSASFPLPIELKGLLKTSVTYTVHWHSHIQILHLSEQGSVPMHSDKWGSTVHVKHCISIRTSLEMRTSPLNQDLLMIGPATQISVPVQCCPWDEDTLLVQDVPRVSKKKKRGSSVYLSCWWENAGGVSIWDQCCVCRILWCMWFCVYSSC